MHRGSTDSGFNHDVSNARAGGQRARALLTAFYLALLFLGAAFSLQARAAATGSDKFIPTFLIYYGGGPALVAADAPKLAKFDLIDVDRFRYANIGSNTWAAIKALNPDIQIYLYETGPDAPSHLDSFAQVNLNGLGRHNVSRGHSMGSLNGNRPELFLLDSAGNRIYNRTISDPAANRYWYLMEFGSTAYQSYWVEAVKADIVDQPWVADGVFADGCQPVANGGYSAVSSLYGTGNAWSEAMNDFAASISGALLRYGQKVWCNRGGTSSAAGAASWLALDVAASPPDVVLEDAAFAHGSGSPAVSFYAEATWKRQVDTLRAITNSKVAVMSHTKLLEGQSGTDNYGKPVSYWQTLWYSLGSFLLARNDDLGNAYFMFRGGSGFNKIWWHDEYDHIDLGKALRPYAVRTIGSVHVYWREFEKGYVYVNPTATAVSSVSLPQKGRRLSRANMSAAPGSIPAVSAISLGGHTAAIVLKTVVAAAPAPDTTAPSVPAGLVGTAASASQVNLSWNASTDNVGVMGYIVYLDNVPIAATTARSFSHSGLAPGVTYNYRVSAYDAVPNHSGWSATPVAVTTPVPPDTTAPSAPTGLTATAVSTTQINLSWSASTDNRGVTGYRVYRGTALLATLGVVTSYQNTGLAASTSYSYTIRALDAAGNVSVPSAAATATTQSVAPALAVSSLLANSDAANVYYSVSYTGTPARINVFLDTDRAAGTGFPTSGIGASYMVEIGAGYGNLYSYSGTGGAWAWTLVKAVTYTNANGVANITLARADIGSPAGVDLVAGISGSPTVYSAKVTQTLSGGGSTPPPSAADFFCTFPTAPTNCGFVVQEKVPGRASIVGFGRDGGTALRLHTEPGDNNVANSGDMQRTDVYLAQSGGAPIVFNEGEEQWWAVSMMFPNDFAFPTWQNYNLHGFHHTGSTGSGNFRVGFEQGAGQPTTAPGVLMFRGHGGPTVNGGSFGVPVLSGTPQRNVWYDFVYHVKWSSGSGGFFRAWVNGVKKLDHSGPTLYTGQGAYFKLANYHTPICDPYPACIGTDPASSIIFDRVVYGPTPQSVSLGPLEGVLTSVNGVLTLVGGF